MSESIAQRLNARLGLRPAASTPPPPRFSPRVSGSLTRCLDCGGMRYGTGVHAPRLQPAVDGRFHLVDCVGRQVQDSAGEGA